MKKYPGCLAVVSCLLIFFGGRIASAGEPAVFNITAINVPPGVTKVSIEIDGDAGTVATGRLKDMTHGQAQGVVQVPFKRTGGSQFYHLTASCTAGGNTIRTPSVKGRLSPGAIVRVTVSFLRNISVRIVQVTRVDGKPAAGAGVWLGFTPVGPNATQTGGSATADAKGTASNVSMKAPTVPGYITVYASEGHRTASSVLPAKVLAAPDLEIIEPVNITVR